MARDDKEALSGNEDGGEVSGTQQLLKDVVTAALVAGSQEGMRSGNLVEAPTRKDFSFRLGGISDEGAKTPGVSQRIGPLASDLKSWAFVGQLAPVQMGGLSGGKDLQSGKDLHGPNCIAVTGSGIAGGEDATDSNIVPSKERTLPTEGLQVEKGPVVVGEGKGKTTTVLGSRLSSASAWAKAPPLGSLPKGVERVAAQAAAIRHRPEAASRGMVMVDETTWVLPIGQTKGGSVAGPIWELLRTTSPTLSINSAPRNNIPRNVARVAVPARLRSRLTGSGFSGTLTRAFTVEIDAVEARGGETSGQKTIIRPRAIAQRSGSAGVLFFDVSIDPRAVPRLINAEVALGSEKLAWKMGMESIDDLLVLEMDTSKAALLGIDEEASAIAVLVEEGKKRGYEVLQAFSHHWPEAIPKQKVSAICRLPGLTATPKEAVAKYCVGKIPAGVILSDGKRVPITHCYKQWCAYERKFVGHDVKACPMLRCFACGRNGHKARECRQQGGPTTQGGPNGCHGDSWTIGGIGR